jgi:ornithine carbamoyltransferase
MTASPRHFLDISDFERPQLDAILDASSRMKEARRGHPQGETEPGRPLAGRVLAMIFEKPSTRTRVSFDVAMRQMGGETLLLTADEMQLGRGETVADTARVLSRFVDAIMIRASNFATLDEMVRHSGVPVINGLTDRSHPCQVMADIMTLREHKGPLERLTVAWTGDSCNVTNSWMQAAARYGFKMRIASPELLQPETSMLAWAQSNGAQIAVTEDPYEAVKGADCVVTDTWVSMSTVDAGNRHNLLKPYQVNSRLMAAADPGAVFMHCLPAHRGEEVTDEVMDAPASLIFDEAENRLHVQKSILLHCLGNDG